jgi:hypothetical protein
VIVLHEHITWYQPVGALIVLLGVAVSQGVFRNLRRSKTPLIPAEATPALPTTPGQAQSISGDNR